MSVPNHKAQFKRRSFQLEGSSLPPSGRIKLIIEVGDRRMVEVQAREPGMIGFFSRPDSEGFSIEIVEFSGASYGDRIHPGDESDIPLEQWQIDALGLQ